MLVKIRKEQETEETGEEELVEEGASLLLYPQSPSSLVPRPWKGGKSKVRAMCENNNLPKIIGEEVEDRDLEGNGEGPNSQLRMGRNTNSRRQWDSSMMSFCWGPVEFKGCELSLECCVIFFFHNATCLALLPLHAEKFVTKLWCSLLTNSAHH